MKQPPREVREGVYVKQQMGWWPQEGLDKS